MTNGERVELYFNGVRPDGEYGMQPMSPEDFMEQIWSSRDAADEAVTRLEKQLQRQTLDKLQELVGVLVTYMHPEGQSAAPQDEWREQLAQDLTVLLMGESYRDSGYMLELHAQLEQDLEATIQLMVTYLAKNQVKDLVSFLLNPDPDMRDEFKEKLKREADQTLIDIQTQDLAESQLAELSAGETQRLIWCEDLYERLFVLQIPLQSLTALSDFKYVVTRPMETTNLVKNLEDVLPDNRDWASMIESLTAIQDDGRKARWSDVVDALNQGLRALAQCPYDAATWKKLFSVLSAWLDELRRTIGHLGLIEGLDPTKLNEAGWGIIFPARMRKKRRDAIKAALEPLLCLRLCQVDLSVYGSTDKHQGKSLEELLEIRAGNDFNPKYQERFKIYESDGYRPNDTARSFLNRHGARPQDPANPDLVPYYLLIVGSPEEIPFRFQYQLDVQYAVGRIDFGDDTDAYRNYADNVVAAERGQITPSKQVTFFGVSNNGDPSTQLSAEHLIKPLFSRFEEKVKESAWKEMHPAWEVERVLPEDATKEKLLDLLVQPNPPAFLFTASHGMEFENGHPQQIEAQGALVCKNWKGPHAPGEEKLVKPCHYVAGGDIETRENINMQGMIAFFFACYGAGTPLYDEFHHQAFKDKGETLAAQPFVAALPKAMLSLKDKGALAVIGHVERTWGTSFMQPQGNKKRSDVLPVFESTLQRLLTGHPVGSAMEHFDVSYAALSTELTTAMDTEWGPQPSDEDMAKLWTENNDARGYIVIGDPAVRLGATQKST